MSTTAVTPETLVGSIERVTFHNPDNGFAVRKTAVKGHRDLVTLVGHLAFAIPGEYVETKLRWVVAPPHESRGPRGTAVRAGLDRTARLRHERLTTVA